MRLFLLGFLATSSIALVTAHGHDNRNFAHARRSNSGTSLHAVSGLVERRNILKAGPRDLEKRCVCSCSCQEEGDSEAHNSWSVGSGGDSLSSSVSSAAAAYATSTGETGSSSGQKGSSSSGKDASSGEKSSAAVHHTASTAHHSLVVHHSSAVHHSATAHHSTTTHKASSGSVTKASHSSSTADAQAHGATDQASGKSSKSSSARSSPTRLATTSTKAALTVSSSKASATGAAGHASGSGSSGSGASNSSIVISVGAELEESFSTCTENITALRSVVSATLERFGNTSEASAIAAAVNGSLEEIHVAVTTLTATITELKSSGHLEIFGAETSIGEFNSTITGVASAAYNLTYELHWTLLPLTERLSASSALLHLLHGELYAIAVQLSLSLNEVFAASGWIAGTVAVDIEVLWQTAYLEKKEVNIMWDLKVLGILSIDDGSATSSAAASIAIKSGTASSTLLSSGPVSSAPLSTASSGTATDVLTAIATAPSLSSGSAVATPSSTGTPASASLVLRVGAELELDFETCADKVKAQATVITSALQKIGSGASAVAIAGAVNVSLVDVHVAVSTLRIALEDLHSSGELESFGTASTTSEFNATISAVATAVEAVTYELHVTLSPVLALVESSSALLALLKSELSGIGNALSIPLNLIFKSGGFVYRTVGSDIETLWRNAYLANKELNIVFDLNKLGTLGVGSDAVSPAISSAVSASAFEAATSFGQSSHPSATALSATGATSRSTANSSSSAATGSSTRIASSSQASATSSASSGSTSSSSLTALAQEIKGDFSTCTATVKSLTSSISAALEKVGDTSDVEAVSSAVSASLDEIRTAVTTLAQAIGDLKSSGSLDVSISGFTEETLVITVVAGAVYDLAIQLHLTLRPLLELLFVSSKLLAAVRTELSAIGVELVALLNTIFSVGNYATGTWGQEIGSLVNIELQKVLTTNILYDLTKLNLIGANVTVAV
ncbi:hypothetical protein JCM8097_002385 [Rhodosporidiobolus ruineniae]